MKDLYTKKIELLEKHKQMVCNTYNLQKQLLDLQLQSNSINENTYNVKLNELNDYVVNTIMFYDEEIYKLQLLLNKLEKTL